MNALATHFQKVKGFTLVELMVSMGLISLLALLMVSMTDSTSSTWRYTTGKIEQFRGAEMAFESMTRRLSQATLNTYWDYDNPTAPRNYIRQSDLRFITGRMTGSATDNPKPLLTTSPARRPTHGVFFQAPLGYVTDETNFSGLDNLLNTWGYFVEFGQDTRPPFIDLMQNPPERRYRYRLMEFMQPSNSLSVYKWTSGQPNYAGKDWFAPALQTTGTTSSPTHVLADNVIALVLLPKLSKKDEDATKKQLTKDFSYDSTNPTNITDPDINPKNQLPPIIQVTVVAIDETAAARIADGVNPPAFDPILDTLFLNPEKFTADLDLLQKTLSESRPPVSFRVFTSSVSIRGAKWSRK